MENDDSKFTYQSKQNILSNDMLIRERISNQIDVLQSCVENLNHNFLTRKEIDCIKKRIEQDYTLKKILN